MMRRHEGWRRTDGGGRGKESAGETARQEQREQRVRVKTENHKDTLR